MREVQRDKSGKFKPGSSGNPSGRPKKKSKKEMCETVAYDTLIAVAVDTTASASARIAAALAILDRLFGKPVQASTGVEGGAGKVVYNVINGFERAPDD